MECYAEEMEKKRPHLLLFPFPGRGHMIPLLELAHSLASHELAVTLLTTTQNEPFLKSLITTASSLGLPIQPLFLPLPPTDGLPPPSENMPHLPLHLRLKFICSFKELAHPIEQWFLQQQQDNRGFGPPICMISDFFLGWTQDTAAKLGIPRVVFYPSGALAVSVIHSLWKHLPHEGVESDDAQIPIPEFPHPLTFRKSQISPLVRMYKRSDPVLEFIKYSMDLNAKSWGSVINTFDDLESLYLHHMEKAFGRPVWSIGPLLPSDVSQGKHGLNVVCRGNPNSVTESTCLQWLDSRKEKSVIYICFGSMAVLSNKQIHEVAAGLEASEESFLWVMKNPPHSRISDNADECGGVLPQGFEERTRERGLVIRGWAPQLSILSHPSVGGFLTHCGWNSMLESIALGVPMIAWPMSADQQSNALLLVEYLRVGVRICEGATAVPSRDELKTAMKRVVGREGEEGKRAEELSKAAKMSVQEGGSSWKNLKAFVSEMNMLAPS